MTSDVRAHQVAEVIPHDTWLASDEYAQALAYVTRHAPDLIDALGLNGRGMRTYSYRATDNAKRQERRRRERGAA